MDNQFRFKEIERLDISPDNYRNDYDRDYARIIHSPAFRRLQGKTQLFPGNESDFFRNRLTHSLEVSQIAESIARKLNHDYDDLEIIEKVCSCAGLTHDLGHPPFGHHGEAALNECMKEYGGFEGNAQTLRILTKLEKKEFSKDKKKRVGLNLTARTLASILKYDNKIPLIQENNSQIIKGYYESESDIVDKLKEVLDFDKSKKSKFKSIECQIMDIADDIAYSTYDIEDAFKGGFLKPIDLLNIDNDTLKEITELIKTGSENLKINEEQLREAIYDLFSEVWELEGKDINISKDNETKNLEYLIDSYSQSNIMANDAYERTAFTSDLVNRFINGIKVEKCVENPIFSKVYLDDDTYVEVNILKYFSRLALIFSSRLKIAESRDKRIIKKIFEKLNTQDGEKYLPEDFQILYNEANTEAEKARVICDFIAGMTDRYAIEFYNRLYSTNPESIYKPIW